MKPTQTIPVTAVFLLALPAPPRPSGRTYRPGEAREERRKLYDAARGPLLAEIEKLRGDGHDIRTHQSASPLPVVNVTALPAIIELLGKLSCVRRVTPTVQTRKPEAGAD